MKSGLLFFFLALNITIISGQPSELRCTVRIEYRQYCFEGRDCGVKVAFNTIIDCPEEVIDSNIIPPFDTIKTYQVINYRRIDVRTATPNEILNQLYLMFDMEKIRTNVSTLDNFALFWDNYFDNAHNLAGRAFIATNPANPDYRIAVMVGLIGTYNVVQKTKIIGSPWSDKNPGGTIYYDEDGREILRLIYGE